MRRIKGLANYFWAFSFIAPQLTTPHTLQFPDPQSPYTVLAFLSAKCPCSAAHESTLKALHQKYSSKGFQFIAVHSNQDESLPISESHFKSAALPFPVVQDEGAKIANQLKALKTPHVYILKNAEIIYQGGVDDSSDPATAQKHFLENALAELSQGKSLTLTQTRALGCIIKR